MKNKSNLTIKVKYPTSGQKAEDDVHIPKVTTEWHVERIVAAISIALISLASLIYLGYRNEPKNIAAEKVAIPPVDYIAPATITSHTENKLVQPENKQGPPIITKDKTIIKKPAIKLKPKKKTKAKVIKSKTVKKQKPVIKKKRHAKKSRPRH